MSKPVIKKPELPKDHKIQGWIDDRFGVPNTVNIQAYKDILSWGIHYCYKEMLKDFIEQIELIVSRHTPSPYRKAQVLLQALQSQLNEVG